MSAPGAATAERVAESAFRSEHREDGIEVVTFDLPGRSANILTAEVMEELRGLVEAWKGRGDIRALVLRSGKEGIWIAGADIDQFARIETKEDGERLCRAGQAIFDALEKLPFPTVAAIDGACLGGGLELALCMTHRIASDAGKTLIGLPEVQLGIVPALGGTQRLPRLVGPKKGLDLILAGKRRSAAEARRDGIVERVYPAATFDEWSLRFAGDVVSGKAPGRRPAGSLLLERNPIGRAVLFAEARRSVRERTSGRYPAPEEAIDCIAERYRTGVDEGLRMEAKAFGRLATGPVSRNLVRLYRWSEAAKKRDPDEPAAIGRAGVLGAGTMGGGIAYLLSSRGIDVRLRDVAAPALAAGLRAARKIHDGRIQRRRETAVEAMAAMDRISPTLALTGLRHADIVIEAVVEDLAIKQKVLAEVEDRTEGRPIFATNTSALPLGRIGERARWPERIVGMHFFNPVHRMPLVEVVRGERTDDEVLRRVVALVRRLGKIPVVVKDSPGFLVNRILGPYIREACLLLEEGQTIEAVDRAMKDFGMPMGPFRMLDEVGVDVALKVAESLGAALGQGEPPSVLGALVKEGRLGKKSGRGFYRHPTRRLRLPLLGSRAVPDETVRELPGIPRRSGGTEIDVVDRLVLPMVNEAVACLDDGVAASAEDVDLATVLGFGFPPFRGGLLAHADARGAKEVVSGTEALASRFGVRLAPHRRLVEMARAGERFHP